MLFLRGSAVLEGVLAHVCFHHSSCGDRGFRSLVVADRQIHFRFSPSPFGLNLQERVTHVHRGLS